MLIHLHPLRKVGVDELIFIYTHFAKLTGFVNLILHKTKL
jgi:hypothetical protein